MADQDWLDPYVKPLRLWLNQPDSDETLNCLDDWLVGAGLPASRDLRPYHLILELLARPTVARQYQRFTRRLAAWLDRKPALGPDSTTEEMQRIETALLLALNLHYPEQICDALGRLLPDSPQATPRLAPGLELLGVPLVMRLRDALIANQIDLRYQEMWRAMAAGRPHWYLGGDYRDGFAGLCNLPAAPDRLGERSLPAVAEGLQLCAETLGDKEQHGTRFQALLDYAVKTLLRSGVSDPGQALADTILPQCRLPIWAQFRLPKHVTSQQRGETLVIIMPSLYQSVLENMEIDCTLVSPGAIEIDAEHIARLIHACAPVFGMDSIKRVLTPEFLPTLDRQTPANQNEAIHNVVATVATQFAFGPQDFGAAR